MVAELTDPAFWNERPDYLTLAHDFTTWYSARAWELAEVPVGAKVLDIAAGAGALASNAAGAGAEVLATDFSQAMVDAIEARRIPGLDAQVMDGQALDLPDASFDAAFSMFGIVLFADWRTGLSEMARVLRPGGIACIGTWKEKSGAAGNLLLAGIVATLFPEFKQPLPIAGLKEFSDPERFRAAMEQAGIGSFQLNEAVSDFCVGEALLTAPDRLFQFSPIWSQLDEAQKGRVVEELQDRAARDGLPIKIASPAWIGIGRRMS